MLDLKVGSMGNNLLKNQKNKKEGMMKNLYVYNILTVGVSFFVFCCGIYAAPIVKVNTNFVDYAYGENGELIWLERNENYNIDVFFYNGSSVSQLTNSPYYYEFLQPYGMNSSTRRVYYISGNDLYHFDGNGTPVKLNNSAVNAVSSSYYKPIMVWTENGDLRGIYNSGSVVQLTNDTFSNDYFFDSHGTLYYFKEEDGYNNLYSWDGISTNQLSSASFTGNVTLTSWHDNTCVGTVDINGKSQLWIYNGTSLMVQPPDGNDYYSPYLVYNQTSGSYLPMVTSNYWDGTDYELVFYDGTSIHQLTNDTINNYSYPYGYYYDPGTNSLAWVENGEIFLWDGYSTTQVTDNPYWENIEKIAGGNVYGNYYDGSDFELYVVDHGTFIQLTDDTLSQYNFAGINNNGHAIWSEYDNGTYTLKLWNGSTVVQLDSGTWIYPLALDNSGQVTWYKQNESDHYDINLWNGTSTEALLTNCEYLSSINRMSSGQWYVLRENEGGTLDLYLLNGVSLIQLVSDTTNPWPLIVGDKYLLYSKYDGSDNEIWAWTGDTIVQLTNDTVDNLYASITDTRAVITQNGNEIWLFENGTISSQLGSVPYNDILDMGGVFSNGKIFIMMNTSSHHLLLMNNGTDLIQLEDNTYPTYFYNLNYNNEFNKVSWIEYSWPEGYSAKLWDGSTVVTLLDSTDWVSFSDLAYDNMNFLAKMNVNGQSNYYLWDGDSFEQLTYGSNNGNIWLIDFFNSRIGLLQDSNLYSLDFSDEDLDAFISLSSKLNVTVGLNYNLSDIYTLWNLYYTRGSGSVETPYAPYGENIGIVWTYFEDPLPPGVNPGDISVEGNVIKWYWGSGLKGVINPEPGTLTLFGIGLSGLGAILRRRKKKTKIKL